MKQIDRPTLSTETTLARKRAAAIGIIVALLALEAVVMLMIGEAMR